MERKRKRLLLARIEGQVLALTQADRVAAGRALNRIEWAVNALRGLPQDEVESVLCRQLEQRVATLRVATVEGQPEKLFVHRRTLARADCRLWQLRLRRMAGDRIVVADN